MDKHGSKITHPPAEKDLLANAISIEGLAEEEEVISLDAEPKRSSKDDVPEAIDLAESDAQEAAKEIRTFDQHHAYKENWRRKPNATGTGAVHVRTFVSKLRLDAIEHLDQQVNDWLDQHPDYEVKFVTASVGVLTGKLKEEAIFMSVWV